MSNWGKSLVWQIWRDFCLFFSSKLWIVGPATMSNLWVKRRTRNHFSSLFLEWRDTNKTMEVKSLFCPRFHALKLDFHSFDFSGVNNTWESFLPFVSRHSSFFLGLALLEKYESFHFGMAGMEPRYFHFIVIILFIWVSTFLISILYIFNFFPGWIEVQIGLDFLEKKERN